jgi:manganese/iron transport system permease protein
LIDQMLIPFTYEYMVNAMLVSALVGGVCACLSCFVMLKGWSLLGDGLSHAVVPGVAVAYKLGWPFAMGAYIAGMAAAMAMSYLKSITRIRQDAIIGVVYTTWFAAGLVFLSIYPASIKIKNIVFGNLLLIAPYDIKQMVVVSIVTLGVLLLKWKDLRLYCFDPSHARTIGLNTWALEATLLVLMTGVAIAALQAVGAALVMAMLITPGATAYLLTDRFGRMMILASVMGSVTAAVGAYASYYLNGSAGGTIVVLQTLVFLVTLVIAPRHGILAGKARAKAAAADLLARLNRESSTQEAAR